MKKNMKKNMKTIIAVWYTQVCVNVIGLPMYCRTTFRNSHKEFFNKTRLGSIFFAILIIPLFFISCANLKKTNTETELKIDSSSGSDTARWIDSKNWGLKPIDISKPMTFTNSKGETETYTNTEVYHNNTHTKEVIHDTIVVKQDLKQEVNTKDKDYSVMIESIANKLFLLIIIIVVLFIIVGFIKNLK